MAAGRAARWGIKQIERYRSHRPVAGAGRCHFEPSCSHFTEESLRTRRLPVALLTSAWRILRCNLLGPARVADPVRRPRRRALRPNAVPTALAAMAAMGLVVLVGAQVVSAQNLEGGCTATANGRDPTTMTRKHPLVVHEGEGVAVIGTVPAGVGESDSLTTIKISLVEGLVEPSTEAHPGTGTQWGDSVDVDDYLKWGVGLYKVEGTATGAGWTCTGDGYVRLEDGSPLSHPVGQAATAVSAVGAVGAVFASRRPSALHTAGSPTAEQVKADFRADAERLLGVEDVQPEPDKLAELLADVGCLGAVMSGALIYMFVNEVSAAAAPVGMAAGASGGSQRIWVRGHPVAGFVSGLFAGLGLTVLIQQFALWPLTIATAIVFPILVGIVGGLRAWRGRPFRIPA